MKSRAHSTAPTNFAPTAAAPASPTIANRSPRLPGQGDPVLSRLPANATAKLRRLQAERRENLAALRDLGERKNDAIRTRHQYDLEIRRLQQDPVVRQRGADYQRILTATIVDRDRAAEQIAELSDREVRLEAKASPLAARLEAYIKDLPSHVEITEHAGNIPTSAKGQTPRMAVEIARERIAALEAEIHRVRSAPQPSHVVKDVVRAQIEALAEQGAPDVLPTIEDGAPVKFPEVNVRAAVNAFVQGGASVGGFATHYAPDATALFAWLFRDQLIAKLESEIDELSDDAAALTDAEKAQQIAAARATILEMERHIEAVIDAAERDGYALDRRANADPRAVLNLASDLPAPQ